jgi:hypothetical protein
MQSTSPSSAHPPPSADRRSAELDRRAEAAGEQLSRLPAADQTPPDRVRTRRQRTGAALRQQSEALAIERRRSRALRDELRRLRGLDGSDDRTSTAN